MATVRKPSSLAARNTRMAISLRFAASSFLIGCNFVGRGLIRGAHSYPALERCANLTLFHARSARPRQFFRWSRAGFYRLDAGVVPGAAIASTGGGAFFSNCSCAWTWAHSLGLALVAYGASG